MKEILSMAQARSIRNLLDLQIPDIAEQRNSHVGSIILNAPNAFRMHILLSKLSARCTTSLSKKYSISAT
jgi:hypothetical protein